MMTEYETWGAIRRDWNIESFGNRLSPFMFSIENDASLASPTIQYVPLASHSWGLAEAVLNRPTAPSTPQDGCEHATGWPMLAAWYGLSAAYPPGGVATLVVDHGIPIEGVGPATNLWTWNASQLRALPLHPIWRGIIVDSLIYAAAWATMFIGIGTIRRALRRRAGRCTRCAYDLSGLRSGTLCPECGSARGAHPTPRAEGDPA